MLCCLSASSNTSAGPNTHSTPADSIRYYHIISVGVICFLIGAITSFVILIHCHQRITPTIHLDHKPAPPPAAAAVSMATPDKRPDVMVTSRDVMVTSRGGVATLQTVIRRSSIDEKIRRTSDSNDVFGDGRNTEFNIFSDVTTASNDVFSAGRANGSTHTALVHLRQYYRRHYTGGVADKTYSRS